MSDTFRDLFAALPHCWCCGQHVHQFRGKDVSWHQTRIETFELGDLPYLPQIVTGLELLPTRRRRPPIRRRHYALTRHPCGCLFVEVDSSSLGR